MGLVYAGGAGSSPGVTKFKWRIWRETRAGITLRELKHPDQKKPKLGFEVGLESKRAKVVSLEGVC
jgi:hypothetical protein